MSFQESERSPLDELEELLKRRAEERRPYLIQMLNMAKDFVSQSEEWVKAEVEVLEKEIGLLRHVVEEDQIAKWHARLRDISRRFKDTLEEIRQLVKRVGSGEVSTLSELVRKKEQWAFQPEEEQAMDIVSLIVRAFNLAREFEELVSSVEAEAKRLLRLRRLVRLEVGASPT